MPNDFERTRGVFRVKSLKDLRHASRGQEAPDAVGPEVSWMWGPGFGLERRFIFNMALGHDELGKLKCGLPIEIG